MKKIFKNKNIKILITSLLCGLTFTYINASAMESSEQKQSQESNSKSNSTFDFKNAMDMQYKFEQAALAQKLLPRPYNKDNEKRIEITNKINDTLNQRDNSNLEELKETENRININVGAMKNNGPQHSQEPNKQTVSTFDFKTAMDMQYKFEQAALAQKLSINTGTI